MPADPTSVPAPPGRPRLGATGADLPPPDHDPAQARGAADEILARSEYRWDDGDDVFDRVGEWIGDQLDRLVSPLGLSFGGLPAWAGWLLIALFAALAAVLVYRSRAGWRRDRGVAADGGWVVVTGDDDAVDWQAEVAACEAAGRWREALRARYRVLVGELARRGVIGDLVGRTSGELAADVRLAAPAAAPSFTEATTLFEAAWYGAAPVGPAERVRFARLAGEALAAADAAASRAVPA